MINTLDSRFNTYYTFESTSIQTSIYACCYLCYADPYCFVFDYHIVTQSCSMYSATINVNTTTDAAISSLFYVLNSQHVSGYYY